MIKPSVYVAESISDEEIRRIFRKRIAENDMIYCCGSYRKKGDMGVAAAVVIFTLFFFGINSRTIINALREGEFLVLILAIPMLFMFTLAYLSGRTEHCYHAFTDKGVMIKDGVHKLFPKSQYISFEMIKRICYVENTVIVYPVYGKSIHIEQIESAHKLAAELCEKYGM